MRAELPTNHSVGRSQTLKRNIEVTIIDTTRKISLTAFMAWASSFVTDEDGEQESDAEDEAVDIRGKLTKKI